MRPTSIGPPVPGEAGWKKWVTDALQLIDAYSQQPFISLIGDVTSPIGGAQIRTKLAAPVSILLNTVPASSSATLSDTTSFTSAYNDYRIVLENIVPATNAVSLEMRVHSGGTFQATTYLNGAGGATTFIDLSQGTIGNNAGIGLSGEIAIYNVNTTNTNKLVRGGVTYYTGAAVSAVNPSGFWNGGQGKIDGLQFLMSAGNIATGNIKIYGIP